MRAIDAMLRDLKTHDFRPRADSPVIDRGARVFVPWALSRVVGEWHFLSSPKPERVLDEHINADHTWLRRSMFQDIPRMDMECRNVDRSHYISGILETWTEGAMRFDGIDQYCLVADSRIRSAFEWLDSRTGKRGRMAGSLRDSLDLDKGDLLIEAVIAVDPDQSGGRNSQQDSAKRIRPRHRRGGKTGIVADTWCAAVVSPQQQDTS